MDVRMEQCLGKVLEGGFEAVSLLREDEGEGLTSYLIQETATGRRLLLKLSLSFSADLLRNEWEILQRIQVAGGTDYPEPVALDTMEVSGERVTWMIRSWIEGTDLERVVEGLSYRAGLPRNVALYHAICVCEQVVFLHGMNPPVIHRDIKPQNVILDRTGASRLIDFGISRNKDGKVDHDTVVAGTRMTSPPEQFGYRQTDERSDVYALGVLLQYLTTGDYEMTEENPAGTDVRDIIARATRFDPKDRYPSAEDMLSDLYRARRMVAEKKKRRTGYLVCCLVLSLMLLVGLGSWLLRTANPVYTFREPLIEAAVRQTLGKPEGALTQEDLGTIKEIHIYGRQIYHSDDEVWHTENSGYFWDAAVQSTGLHEINGGITSLEDLTHLPSLREVGLFNQQISDLSVLSGMQLTELGIGYNPVRDLQPIADMPLKRLNVAGIFHVDTGVLASLASLESLDVSGTDVTDLSALSALPLREMTMINVAEDAFRVLPELSGLGELTMKTMTDATYDAISRTKITSLTLINSSPKWMGKLDAIPTLEHLYFYGDGTELEMREATVFPQLQWLDVKNAQVEDLSFTQKMPQLRQLHIYALECESYEGLLSPSSLEYISCTKAQCEAMRAIYPDATWLWYSD